MQNNVDVLMCDVSNLFVRSYCVLNVINENGQDVSGIVGTINILASIISKQNPKMVVAVYDGKGGSTKKRKQFADYKQGRKFPRKINTQYGAGSEESRQQNFVWQMQKLYEFMNHLPIMQVVVDAYEADEILAYMTKKRFNENQVMILSSDKDFQQLVEDGRVSIYSHSTKTVINEAEVYDKFGALGGGIAVVKSIIPDKSDNIKSLASISNAKPIGVKTLNKIFPSLLSDKALTLDRFFECCEDIVNNDVDMILDNKDKKKAKQFKQHCQDLLNNKDLLQQRYNIVQLQDVDLSLRAISEIDGAVDSFKSNVMFNNIVLRKLFFKDGIPVNENDMERWKTHFLVLKSNTDKFLQTL
jgi:5'-3' exonuclease